MVDRQAMAVVKTGEPDQLVPMKEAFLHRGISALIGEQKSDD